MGLYSASENRRSNDRRHGIKKPAILIIGIVLGVACWAGRHYVLNAPLWAIRSMWADHDEIYIGKTNGVPNRDLVTAARSYISQVQEVEINGSRRSLVDLGNVGVGFSSAWFAKHHPSTVDSNPFFPASEGPFVVSWFYVPGCQRSIHTVSIGPGENWFDLKGQPCYSSYTLSVHMTSDMRLTKVVLQPKNYI